MQVEEGLCDGAVLYHAHVARSKAEVSAQQAAKDQVAKVKAARRQQQEENVRRKEVGTTADFGARRTAWAAGQLVNSTMSIWFMAFFFYHCCCVLASCCLGDGFD